MMDRLSRWLGIDVKYYLTGGGFLFSSYWAVLLLGFLTTWVFTNYAPKETYGAYSYIQSLLGMLIIFTLPGYYTAVVRSAARGHHGALLASVKRRFAFSILGSVILAGVGLYYHAIDGDPVLGNACLLSSAFVGMVYGLDDFRSFLNGRKRYAAYAVLHFAVSLVCTGLTVAAILLTQNLMIILLANLGARGFGQLLCILWAARQRENDDVDPDFTRFGNRQSALAILGNLSFYLDSVIVGVLFPLETMAEYAFANVITNPLRNVGAVINRLIFPKMVKLSGRAFAKKTLSKAFFLIALLAGMGAAYALLLPFVLKWLFPMYASASPYILMMMVSALIGVMVIYLETYYLSQDRFARTYYAVTIVRPALIIVLLPILIHAFGVYGAIGAKLVVRLAETVYLMARLAFGWDDYSPESDSE